MSVPTQVVYFLQNLRIPWLNMERSRPPKRRRRSLKRPSDAADRNKRRRRHHRRSRSPSYCASPSHQRRRGRSSRYSRRERYRNEQSPNYDLHDHRRRRHDGGTHRRSEDSAKGGRRRRDGDERPSWSPHRQRYRSDESAEDQSGRRRRRRHRKKRPRRKSPSYALESEDAAGDRARPPAGLVSDDDCEIPSPKKEPQIVPERRPSYASSTHDDSKGHFQGGPGTMIDGRYRVVRDVGLGTFGRVVECHDLKRARHARGCDDDGAHVAIKIVRKIKRYYESALIEAKIVDDVNRRGGRGTSHCAVMFDAFTWDSHYCMVFENLGPSLYDFMKRHRYQPFPYFCVRDIARQLLETLDFLHSFGLIHTDLKPENILLMNHREGTYRGRRQSYQIPESTHIKIIDFGCATFDDEKKSKIVNTRQYRAPEVILGTGWGKPTDLWSTGCILMELYTGELLFPTHDNVEHLAQMERVISPFPRRLLKEARQSKLVSQAFDPSGKHRQASVLSPESAAFVRGMTPLQSIIRREDDRLLHLLRRLLVIDPQDRGTAYECLRYRL